MSLRTSRPKRDPSVDRELSTSGDELSIGALLREAYESNNRTWASPGAVAIAVHRLGGWAREQRPPLRAPLRKLSMLAFILVRNVYGIELPPTVQVGRRLKIAHQGGIVVHPNAVIGDDCTIRQGVTIGATRDVGYERDFPTIGDRVSIGAGAAVMGRLRVGDDVMIGPNTVVMSNVAAGSIVVCPAPRVMTRRVPDPPTA